MFRKNRNKHEPAYRFDEEEGMPTEKGDIPAMLIAAWVTFMPAAIVALGILCLLFFIWYI